MRVHDIFESNLDVSGIVAEISSLKMKSVNQKKIWKTEKIAFIILKFEQCGFNIV